MARISTYGISTPATAADKLIGSDPTNATKNFTVGSIIDLIGITGTVNTLAMFGTGTSLIDSIITQNATGTIVTIGSDDSQGVTIEATLNIQGPVKDSTGTLGVNQQILESNATGNVVWADQPFAFNEVSIKGIQSATNTASGVDPVQPNGSSFSVGYNNVSSGGASTTIGSLNVASANNSFAGGLSTLASGLRSFAMGGYTVASGFMSAAFGFETVASGTRSFAFGDTTTASGEFSLAHGKDTLASGNYSTTMGVSTVASGERSFAIGDETTASGDFSVSFGKDTTASAYGQMVIGQGNTIDAGESSTLFSTSTRAFVIGNGTVGVPGDAFTVKYNGNAIAHGKLSVGKSILTSEPTSNLEVFGEAMFKSTDGENRVFIGNEGDNPNDSGLIELYGETGILDIKLVGKGNSFIKTGRLGIGFDTTPAFQLEVDSGTADIAARFKSTDTKAAIIVSDNNTTAWMSASGGHAYFGTSASKGEAISVNAIGAVGVNTDTVDPSALLEINSTTKGFLPPRGNTTNIQNITAPAQGLTVYNTTLKTLSLYDGTAWDTVVTGNSGGSRFVDLTTQQAITGDKTFTNGLKINGNLDLNGSGNSVFIGRDAGKSANGGIENVGVGFNALYLNTTGSRNTANGYRALYLNTTGENNVANGYSALFENTSGSRNVANGYSALRSNTIGSQNVANGYSAGSIVAGGALNTTPQNSVFIGNNTISATNNDFNQIVIGNGAVGQGSNTAVIGDASISALYLTGFGAGVVLKSPSGTKYKITVTDAGAIIATAI